MGVFGTLDVDQIPNDPFFVDEGSYSGFIEKANKRVTQDDAKKVVIQYKIDDYDSEDGEANYSGLNVSEWFDDFSDLDQSEINAMDSKERSDLMKKLSRFKARVGHILGDQPDWDEFELEDLVDAPVNFVVVVNEAEDGRRFSNVRYVESAT